jgi:hypothetical protein
MRKLVPTLRLRSRVVLHPRARVFEVEGHVRACTRSVSKLHDASPQRFGDLFLNALTQFPAYPKQMFSTVSGSPQVIVIAGFGALQPRNQFDG